MHFWYTLKNKIFEFDPKFGLYDLTSKKTTLDETQTSDKVQN